MLPSRLEMNLNVFERKPNPYVFFQPRIEPWFVYNKDLGTLPTCCQGMELTELYDSFGMSMRYMHYMTGMPSPVTLQVDPVMEVIDHSYEASSRN